MNIEEARSALEKIDLEIIGLFAERQDYSSIIASEKKKSGMPIRDEAQRDKVIERAGIMAEKSGIERSDVEKIFEILIEMNEKAQKKYI